MLSKKKIKKYLRRPEKARCPDCNFRMLLRSDTVNSIYKKYFECINTGCGYKEDVSNYTLRANGKYFKERRWELDSSDVKDEEEKTLEIVRFKLGDKFYKISDSLEYNPISRIKKTSGLQFVEPVNDLEHSDLTEKIQIALNNIL